MPLLASCLILQLPFQTPSNLTWSHYLYSLPQLSVSTSSHIFLLLFRALVTLRAFTANLCLDTSASLKAVPQQHTFVSKLHKFAVIVELSVLQGRSTCHQPNQSPHVIPAVDDTSCIVIFIAQANFYSSGTTWDFWNFLVCSFIYLDLLQYFLPTIIWFISACSLLEVCGIYVKNHRSRMLFTASGYLNSLKYGYCHSWTFNVE